LDNEETMVENEEVDTEAVDTLDEGITEETDESEESLDSLNEEEQAAEEQPEKPQATEPGYVQRRIDKALAKERDSITATIRAEMEAKYAPIMDRLLEMDAQELLRKGTVKDIETARELVRYRNNQPQNAAPAPKAEQPRQPNGQYAPKEDPVVSARIDILSKQADKIKAKTGIDVIEEFSNNNEVKQKVMRGEIDFYDVADMIKDQKPAKRKAPAPMRSPNGASGTNPNAIDSMSDEQFERMERKIKEGARYTLK